MTKIKTTYLKFSLSFILCLISYFFSAQTKSTNIKTIGGKKYFIHKVEKGQSLYAISKIYAIDVNSILTENDEAIDGLKNGQELKIPFESLLPKQTLAIDTNKYTYHKVLKGETVYAITKKYTIDDKKLATYNPTINNGLKVGDYIIVGEKKKNDNKQSIILSSASGIAADTYTVQQSETMYAIAKKLNVSQEDILKWNPLVKDGIKQGQVLKIGSLKANTTLPIVTSSTIVTIPEDTALIHKDKKLAYNIGLFLPFKLLESENINVDELVRAKSNFPQTQSLALDFYAGFKKAVDSLISKDFDVNIQLFDAEERDSIKIESICKTVEFKKLDAVFGPLYSGIFKLVSSHAKRMGIPIVSPVIQQNKILFDNALVSKVTPSVYTLIESLADYCSDSLKSSSNIIIVNSTTKDQQYIKTFKSRYNGSILKHIKNSKDTITEVKGVAGVKASFITGKQNVVVLLTNNLVYIQDFITQLYAFSNKKNIILMGFNSISNVDNLDQEYLNELKFHFASPNLIDFQDSTIRKFSKSYQEIYTVNPSEYYFQGFDIAMYYLSNLKNQGPDFFLNLDKYNSEGVYTGFKFYKLDNQTGFENKATYIYKYSNYKLQKLGWK
jgi:LysM repeat protein/ABC-type branched-subunit amino acid transport system substrate-binding protein